MTDPTALPTYGAVRAAYVRDRERQYRRESRGIPTAEQRAQWSAEFDRWAGAIRAAAWVEGYRSGWADCIHPNDDHITANPYRED